MIFGNKTATDFLQRQKAFFSMKRPGVRIPLPPHFMYSPSEGQIQHDSNGVRLFHRDSDCQTCEAPFTIFIQRMKHPLTSAFHVESVVRPKDKPRP